MHGKMKRAIIFDSSTLISFAMNGLLEELKKLKGIFKGNFFITQDVKYEIIDRPITIKRFELEALRLKKLLEEGILETPKILGLDEKRIQERGKELLDQANNSFSARGKKVHIIDLGEASCLALSEILTEMKIQNVLAVDERTTRMLSEKPQNLEKLLRKKLHTQVVFDGGNLKNFKQFKFIRSAELIYVAYKKKLISFGNGLLLDALLYALKFKGCSISDQEIKEIKKLG